MNKRIFSFLCILSLLLTGVLSGCGTAQDSTPATTAPTASIDIVLADDIPSAYIDTPYEVNKLFVQEEGVVYTYEARYVDPVSGATKKLIVKNDKLTPKVYAEILLEITATKGKETVSKEISIPMGFTADEIDMLLASDGAAGGNVDGVQKNVTKDAAYLKGEKSTSSLSVSFSNADSGGVELLDLSHYSLTAYYTDRSWKNAVVTFSVYNPMDQDIEFKLTSYDPVAIKANYWDSEGNTQSQIAKAGTWTEVAFSLYKMGIKQVLFSSPKGIRSDSLKVLARYNGSDVCSLYIDNVNVVPASSVEGIETGCIEAQIPAGDFSDLLKTGTVYTWDETAQLSFSTKGNRTKDAYAFGSSEACGYPMFFVDFDKVTDISAFEYLKFDIYAENAYPFVQVGIRYLDADGATQYSGTSYDYYRSTWRTLYLNLDYLKNVDLTRAVGVYFAVHMGNRFVADEYNCVYFDNVMLYDYNDDQPVIPAATVEDHDLISGPFSVEDSKPGVNGVCKVATDETGLAKSNSALMFWTNNASGYPNPVATFMFDQEQDWSDKMMLNVDTHQDNAHYWMGFTIIALDDNGNQVTYFFCHDTVLTNWMTNSFPLSWFRSQDQEGASAKPEDLKRVIGLMVTVDLAANVTSEVGQIFFDNITVS